MRGWLYHDFIPPVVADSGGGGGVTVVLLLTNHGQGRHLRHGRDGGEFETRDAMDGDLDLPIFRTSVWVVNEFVKTRHHASYRKGHMGGLGKRGVGHP